MRDFAEKVAEADQSHRSWREKLSWVQHLFADDDVALDDEQLVDLAIYLRFLGTGQLACAEDGHHYRPSHHARISRAIHEHLAAMATAENAPILRRIYPWLPSHAAPFTRAEPLTRIRDIAHRNDIPRALKQEIKHTLQNKLHRCAGPEDVATSAALLQRITAPDADYPPAFVEQFRMFHRELEQFFGRRSLEERLRDLARDSGDALRQHIEDFVTSSWSPQQVAASPTAHLEALTALTDLREQLHVELKDATSPDAQQRLLTDIALEDQAFLLLSTLAEQVAVLSSEESWQNDLAAIELAVNNVRLSGIAPAECLAVAAEIAAWRREFDPRDHQQLLRLKASIARCQRLTSTHADRMIDIFSLRAQVLGQALDIAEHVAEVFCQAELRAHVVFQLDKLVSRTDEQIRSLSHSSAWNVVVSGHCCGRLHCTENLEQLAQPASSDSIIAIVRRANGDEFIPTGVVGIVLEHDIPRLSHLAVRARQDGISFVTADRASAERRALDAMVGSIVAVRATEAEVSIEPADGAAICTTQIGMAPNAPAIIKQPKVCGRQVLPLADATVANAGAKAAGARRLELLSRSGAAGFRAPTGVVVPFGVLESVIGRSPPRMDRYKALVTQLDDEMLVRQQETDILAHLRAIIHDVPVGEELIAAVLKALPNQRLMVRSSANCEDLPGLSGAGLYASVANVAAGQLATAVRHVWASLWSHRAVISRQQQRIPQRSAQMAILIQPMIVPELSFVMHTANPLSGDTSEVWVELAVGNGDVLASGGQRGTPYQLVCDPQKEHVDVKAYANFSHALRPGDEGGLVAHTVDYSQVPFSCDGQLLQRLGVRLARAGKQVARAAGRAQDIEGALANDELWLVQTRDQTGPAAEVRPSTHADTESEQAMQNASPPLPHLLGLFEKRIEGDHTLLALAQYRLHQAGLGAECYPHTREHFDQLVRYWANTDAPQIAHLPRHIDLLTEPDRKWVGDFARHAAGRVSGLVVHDQIAMTTRGTEYRAILAQIDAELARIDGGPRLFVEYAVGHELPDFTDFFVSIDDLEHVSPCVDIGHIGIRQTRTMYARRRTGQDVCALNPYDERLPDLIHDVQHAVQASLAPLFETIEALGECNKPVHFHLHDGHPLWHLSSFGVSDHIGFLDLIALPFEYEGQRWVGPIFGPSGLTKLLETAVRSIPLANLSFTLEIHPIEGRMPLGELADLFSYWKNKTNAERMNFWLAVLVRNAALVRETLATVMGAATAETSASREAC